jgi:hypothetical protein
VYSPFEFFSNVRLLYSIDNGESWVGIDSLTPTIMGYGYPRLAASADGRIAFVYHIWDPDWHMEDSSYVKLRVSTDSGITWSAPVDISDSTFTNHTPRLDMRGDTIVVCWYSSNGLVVRRSFDLGQTWQPVEIIGGGEGDIALDGETIHITYLGNHCLYYRRWEPGTEAIDDPPAPTALSLSPVYPNPFNVRTTISFSLPARGEARLEIFDILGHKVATLHEGMLDAGQYRTTWDAAECPSGVYLARLASGGQVRTRSMALIK